MVNKYKNVMAYLTDHSGKLTNTTEAVTFLYNLLQEEVNDYFDYVRACVRVCVCVCVCVCVSEFSSHNHF